MSSGVGMPAALRLEAFGRRITEAFGKNPYQVGSSLRATVAGEGTWRDVDVRLMLDDDEFTALFPDYGELKQHDPRWGLICDAISEVGHQMTGLPIDFQIQSVSAGNAEHPGPRSALGLRYVTKRELGSR